jgi:hypothetical protein
MPENSSSKPAFRIFPSSLINRVGWLNILSLLGESYVYFTVIFALKVFYRQLAHR